MHKADRKITLLPLRRESSAGKSPALKSKSETKSKEKRNKKTMKKLTSSLLIILLGVVACSPVKQNRYQDGTYTAVNSGCGYIITADGNIWGYFDKTIPSGSSVLISISDEGSEEIEDDVITNVVTK